MSFYYSAFYSSSCLSLADKPFVSKILSVLKIWQAPDLMRDPANPEGGE